MKTRKKPEPIPHLKSGQFNSYSPQDIKRWGTQRFLDEVCEKEPLLIPDLEFTREEDQKMDEILREEREASKNGL